MPPLFYKNQQLDESEPVDYLANKAPRSHKAMFILQVFNLEAVDLETFVEHFERADTTDNIATERFSASYEYSDINKHKKCSKKKLHKEKFSLYCSLHGEKNSYTFRECKVLKARAKYKDNPKYGKKDYKKKFKELNLLEGEASH